MRRLPAAQRYTLSNGRFFIRRTCAPDPQQSSVAAMIQRPFIESSSRPANLLTDSAKQILRSGLRTRKLTAMVAFVLSNTHKLRPTRTASQHPVVSSLEVYSTSVRRRFRAIQPRRVQGRRQTNLNRCGHSHVLNTNGKLVLISQEVVHHVGIDVAQILMAKTLGLCAHNRKPSFCHGAVAASLVLQR